MQEHICASALHTDQFYLPAVEAVPELQHPGEGLVAPQGVAGPGWEPLI